MILISWAPRDSLWAPESQGRGAGPLQCGPTTRQLAHPWLSLPHPVEIHCVQQKNKLYQASLDSCNRSPKKLLDALAGVVGLSRVPSSLQVILMRVTSCSRDNSHVSQASYRSHIRIVAGQCAGLTAPSITPPGATPPPPRAAMSACVNGNCSPRPLAHTLGVGSYFP